MEILKDPMIEEVENYSSEEEHNEAMNINLSTTPTSMPTQNGCKEDSETFDLSNWWKVNSSKYPTLSKVAKTVLAIPISTVASESAFSTSGRVIDPFRSSLASATMESLICAQNWLRSMPVQIDLRAAMDDVEKFEEIASELTGSSSTYTIEPSLFNDDMNDDVDSADELI